MEIIWKIRSLITNVLLAMYAPMPQKSLHSNIEYRHLHGRFFNEFCSIGSAFKNLPLGT